MKKPQRGYLSGCTVLGVDLHGRMDAQPPLETAEIAVGNILPDHPAQLLPAGKSPAITLPLEDTPETLYRPVVNTLPHSRYTPQNTLVVYGKPLSPRSKGWASKLAARA